MTTEQVENKTPKIYAAIADICEEVQAIGKSHETTSGPKYNFRSIDDVINVMHPLLRKHRVFSTAELVRDERTERKNERGGTMTFAVQLWKYTYFADDGSSVTSQAMGEGFDSGDKSSTKAQSMAWRIGMCVLFHIPYAELMDSEAGEQHEVMSENVALERRAQAAILAVKDHAALERCYQQLDAYEASGELSKPQADRLRLLCGEQDRGLKRVSDEDELTNKAAEAIAQCQDREALKAYEARIEQYKKEGKLSAPRVSKLYAMIGGRIRELRGAETEKTQVDQEQF